ncbi:hypothetical protein L484_014379 [Morus notabilis]|uniref:Uncharacterized protein n=1 Tax=Morus notabilis TaxID=981085 RepID=W9RTR8_9ROSA|nr:hypothetical protein L484_014379 [Morus notabilis]
MTAKTGQALTAQFSTIGAHKHRQVPWGSLLLPRMEKWIKTYYDTMKKKEVRNTDAKRHVRTDS